MHQQAAKYLVRRKKTTKREILFLVGLPQHASKVVQPERIFTARMYCTAVRLKKLHHLTCLNRDFCLDVHWWHIFINSWNGFSLCTCHTHFQVTFDCHVQTDTSGSWGCTAIFANLWFQCVWSAEWSTVGMMARCW